MQLLTQRSGRIAPGAREAYTPGMLPRNAAGASRGRRVPGWMMAAALFLVAGLGLMRGGGGRTYAAGFSEQEAELLFGRGHGAPPRGRTTRGAIATRCWSRPGP